MKRLIYLVVLYSLAFINTQKVLAQDDSEKVAIGIKVGYNMGKLKQISEDSYSSNILPGFNAGFIVDIPLKFMPNLYLQPGLSYSMKGGRYVFDGSGSFGGSVGMEYKDEIQYAELPVLLSYRYPLTEKIKVYADLGPYLSFLVNKSENSGDSFNEGFNGGIILGAGVKFGGFGLGIQYDWGLADVADHRGDFIGESYSIKTRTASLYASYAFTPHISRGSYDDFDLKKNQFGLFIGYPFSEGSQSFQFGLQNIYNFNNTFGWVMSLSGSLASVEKQNGKSTEKSTEIGPVQIATGLRATSAPLIGKIAIYGQPQIGYGYNIKAENGDMFYGVEAGIDISRKLTIGAVYTYTKTEVPIMNKKGNVSGTEKIGGGGWGIQMGYSF